MTRRFRNNKKKNLGFTYLINIFKLGNLTFKFEVQKSLSLSVVSMTHSCT